jgi:hypothetical protein
MSRKDYPALVLVLVMMLCLAPSRSAAREEKGFPEFGPPPSTRISEACRAQLEYEEIRAAEAPLFRLGECVYDFLAFIDPAELIRARGSDGFVKQADSFFSAHMERYASRLKHRLEKAFPGEDEFARRKRAVAMAEALHRESALVQDFIERSRGRRRYYVEGVTVDFSLAGPYDFDRRVYDVQAEVATHQHPAVFYGLCELRVDEIPLRFTLPIDPADAERISHNRGRQQIHIDRNFPVVPGIQGVYEPSWLFRGTQHMATARLDVGRDFLEEVEMRIKKWYFFSEPER